MITRPTGSKIHRAWKCPPSLVLPQIEDDEPSPAADRGKVIHAFLERVRAIGFDAAIAEVPPEHRLICECLNLEELPVHLATEVAFLYDYKSRRAREIGRGIGRDYAGHLARTGQAPIGPYEIPATFDVVGWAEAPSGRRRGYAGDYKSGRTKYPAPDRFGQTLLAGLCVRSVYGCDDVILELIYLGSDGKSYPARRLIDEWDLDTFADELAAAMDLTGYAAEEYAAGRALPMLREGPHCEHCPAYLQCPAKIGLVRHVPGELVALGITPEVVAAKGTALGPPGTVAGGAITRARAAEVYETIERIESVFDVIKQQICMMAAHDSIELSDGRVIGRLQTTRENLVGKVAAVVIEQMFGAEARERAVELKVTKEALQKEAAKHAEALKAKGQKAVIQSKKGDGILDRALAEIKQRGGIEVATTDGIKPHVPRRKALKA